MTTRTGSRFAMRPNLTVTMKISASTKHAYSRSSTTSIGQDLWRLPTPGLKSIGSGR